MDTVTQGLLGAAASHACFSSKIGNKAWRVGLIAGMLADVDQISRVFSSDPLSYIEFHRHFTHSLAFIPIGALLVALFLLIERFYRKEFKYTYLSALIGYGTHGLLDVFTSYGTVFFWPFSKMRVSLDYLSIIDPIFTLILLVGLIWAVVKKSARPAVIALCLCILYTGFGAYQHSRAVDIQKNLAIERGHQIERARLMPTIGNAILWRSLYESRGQFYSDAIRLPLFGKAKMREGETIRALTLDKLKERVKVSAQNISDFKRFHWFSDGYTVMVSEKVLIIGDIRYSRAIGMIDPLWGIQFDRYDSKKNAEWIQLWRHSKKPRLKDLWGDVLGRGEWREITPKHLSR